MHVYMLYMHGSQICQEEQPKGAKIGIELKFIMEMLRPKQVQRQQRAKQRNRNNKYSPWLPCTDHKSIEFHYL